MLEVYGTNVTAVANTPLPFNNTSVKKGCTAELESPSTIQLNKCGVYMVSFDGSTAADNTVQMFKDGVAQPQAQSTGTSPSFVTLVQVDHNNNNCCCSSPVNLRFIPTAAGTFTSINVCVTKIC